LSVGIRTGARGVYAWDQRVELVVGDGVAATAPAGHRGQST
jgi:hypothetical protein